MALDCFRCPRCKGTLTARPGGFDCFSCAAEYPVVDGIPDFFVSETEGDAIDEPSKTWLDAEIVEARDTVYRLCARELRGMAFCMQAIAERTDETSRILEVGMGTGHFTRWMAEVSRFGTQVYAFDFSWPIIDRARSNTRGVPGITLFRANARGPLPFQDEAFDIVLVRLAPLGAHGVPNVQAGYQMLKPGGWYFQAGWEPTHYETAPTEWALRHGYDSAEYHEWRYWRTQTQEEIAAWQTEQLRLNAGTIEAPGACRPQRAQTSDCSVGDGPGSKLTHEHILIAQKPASA
jgi:SAM-dependent methyltransferase